MKNFVKISKKEYRDLLAKALFKTFFHNPEWHEFLEKEFKWLKFEYYLYKPACRQAENKVLFPLAKINGKLISLPFCEYGGPLPLKENINFEQFKKDVLSKFKNIKIKFHPKLIESGIMNHESGIATYWLDLRGKSEKESLACFRKTLRHSIRNAQRQDLEIKKCSNLKELKQFYNLYVANLKKRKTVPYPYSIFKFLFSGSETEILLVLYKNRIIGGDLFLNYNGFVHYFISASDYKYRKLGASYLILWEKIKSLAGKDVIFDLGASPKGSALETFKRGWRGKEYPILQIGIKRSEESLRSSGLIRTVWSLLPTFVIKKISPYFIKYRI